MSVDFLQLKRLVELVEKAEAEYPNGMYGWTWLSHVAFDDLCWFVRGNLATDPGKVHKLRELFDRLERLWVLRSMQRALPELYGDSSLKRQPFRPGIFIGTVYVFDFSSGALLCQAPVAATATRYVTIPRYGTQAGALFDDFKSEVRAAVSRAVILAPSQSKTP